MKKALGCLLAEGGREGGSSCLGEVEADVRYNNSKVLVHEIGKEGWEVR